MDEHIRPLLHNRVNLKTILHNRVNNGLYSTENILPSTTFCAGIFFNTFITFLVFNFGGFYNYNGSISIVLELLSAAQNVSLFMLVLAAMIEHCWWRVQ